jgi:hypothetical protein
MHPWNTCSGWASRCAASRNGLKLGVPDHAGSVQTVRMPANVPDGRPLGVVPATGDTAQCVTANEQAEARALAAAYAYICALVARWDAASGDEEESPRR